VKVLILESKPDVSEETPVSSETSAKPTASEDAAPNPPAESSIEIIVTSHEVSLDANLTAEVKPTQIPVANGDVARSADDAAAQPVPSPTSNDIALTESKPPAVTEEVSSHHVLEPAAEAAAETAAEASNDAVLSAPPFQAEVSNEASASEPDPVQGVISDTFDTADAAKSASAGADEKTEEELKASDASSPVQADDIQVG
jgi:hypothetical protein